MGVVVYYLRMTQQSFVTLTILTLISSSLLLTPFSHADAATYRTRRYDGEEIRGNINDWRRGNSALQSKIDDLDSDPVDDLPIPVLFGVALRNLTKNFGDPRSGHTHEGLDIMAREGTPVVSPTDAVVIRTGEGDSAGNYVTTANPGDESFVYMHLSKIADIDEGDVLEKGDIIGYVGHTGNAVAAAPHLHFEIHDEDGEPTDPFPRLTEVFALDDKIDYLEEIFDNESDDEELAEFLVTNFRSDFVTAQAQNLELPSDITDALKKLPATSVSSSSSSTNSSILKVGSKGTAVQELQAFLIKKDIGSSDKVVADGSFGPITRQALIDYQASVGLTSDGVAGPKTLAYIAAHK